MKVGQIYLHNNGLRYCITEIDEEFANYISSLGITYCEKVTDLIGRLGLLVAEYPNWQEAVNSPDFKGVDEPKKYIKIKKHKYVSALQKADGLRLRLDETITALRLIAANTSSRPEWSKQRFSLTLGNVRRVAEGMLERLGQWY